MKISKNSLVAALILALSINTHAMNTFSNWIEKVGLILLGATDISQLYLSPVAAMDSPQSSPPTEFHRFTELPKDLQNEIIGLLTVATTAKSMKEALETINALSQVNKQLNTLINSPEYRSQIMKHLAQKFNINEDAIRFRLQPEKEEKRWSLENIQTLEQAVKMIDKISKNDNTLNSLMNNSQYCLQMIKHLAQKFNTNNSTVAEALQRSFEEASRRLIMQKDFFYNAIKGIRADQKSIPNLKKYIEDGIDINWTNPSGSGKNDIISPLATFLFDNFDSASINGIDNYNIPIPYYKALPFTGEIAKILINAGADPNQQLRGTDLQDTSQETKFTPLERAKENMYHLRRIAHSYKDKMTMKEYDKIVEQCNLWEKIVNILEKKD